MKIHIFTFYAIKESVVVSKLMKCKSFLPRRTKEAQSEFINITKKQLVRMLFATLRCVMHIRNLREVR